jgi:hypothetical protein
VAIGEAFEIFRRSRRLRHLAMVGVQAQHRQPDPGPEPLAETARELSTLRCGSRRKALRSNARPGRGSGVGDQIESLSPETYAAAVLPQLAGLSFEF